MKLTSLLTILSLCLASAGASFAQGTFMRFPLTLSPDGAWVLGWGSPAPDGKLGGMKEAKKQETPEKEEPDNYLIDATTGQVRAVIPGINYWDNLEYHQNHGGIEVAWGLGGESAFIIHEGKWSPNGMVWIDTTSLKVTDVHEQIDAAVNRLVLKDHGKKNAELASTHIFEKVVIPTRGLLMMNTEAYCSDKQGPDISFDYQLKFKVITEANGATLQLLKARSLKKGENVATPYIADDQIDAELNKAYSALREKLDAAERSDLKAEEIKWLKARETMPSDDYKLRFTRLRILQLKLRALDR